MNTETKTSDRELALSRAEVNPHRQEFGHSKDAISHRPRVAVRPRGERLQLDKTRDDFIRGGWSLRLESPGSRSGNCGALNNIVRIFCVSPCEELRQKRQILGSALAHVSVVLFNQCSILTSSVIDTMYIIIGIHSIIN